MAFPVNIKFPLKFRPIRSNAVIMGGFLLGALGMALAHDFSIATLSAQANEVINLVVDASVVMVVFTGYVTALTKLCDDGGESDAVKVVREFLNHEDPS